ncbi:class I SAM-dependent methyltransferase [Paenibacillus sp. UNC499MF]|uniref:class I SAM-dependent methyltransferase n=1 Tax=Paenibacillus sp. UNC499MF TaxID=1502751 RepID=UPI00089FC95A|nr:class I SAM-dependent methyltransferase [Paenibacillus sp. UNC499MF]SEG72632.1 Methyltransferase domain-containing protein [Paenibacillus sp. UNC499MF]
METKRFYEQTGVAMTCRNFEEYVRMFDLDPDKLRGKRVLDTGAGASAFTAEASRRDIHACAADPLYAMEPSEIEGLGREEIDRFIVKLTERRHMYDWDFYGGPELLKELRKQSFADFSADYANPVSREQRYTAASLPELPHPEGEFDLVLCSHFLFLYGEQFSPEFHLQAMRELLRVCKPGGEVRIYPLLTFGGESYPQLPALLKELAAEGVTAEYRPTRLAFIPGSKDYLTLHKVAD